MQPNILIEIKSTNLGKSLEKSQRISKNGEKKKQNFEFSEGQTFLCRKKIFRSRARKWGFHNLLFRLKTKSHILESIFETI